MMKPLKKLTVLLPNRISLLNSFNEEIYLYSVWKKLQTISYVFDYA